MKIRIKKIREVEGTVTAPPSKSYTHRAIIISSLADGKSILHNCLIAGDTISTLKACRTFGIRIDENGGEISVYGSRGDLKTPEEAIDVGNSGTTLRLVSGLAALDGRVTLSGDLSIQQRPMQPLLDALNQLKVKARSTKQDGTPPIVIEGKGLKGGEVKIRGDISSQFISSLLISLPYAQKDTTIELITELISRPYVDITIDIMDDFGIRVRNEDYEKFYVKAGECYGAREYTIEGDYSSSSYFMALAAITNSKISIENLAEDSRQGDKIFLDILRDMGTTVRVKKDKVRVEGGRLKGIEIDLRDTPDLISTTALLASKAEGETVIKNVEHARFKETDRLHACAEEFKKFGARIEERKDSLVIEGTEKLKGAKVQSYRDHRMAMALTIAGLCAEGETILEGAEFIDISFPGFMDILRTLGANIEV